MEASLHGLAGRNAVLAEVMPRNESGRGVNDISDKPVML